MGITSHHKNWLSATAALAIVGTVALATFFSRGGLADDAELMMLMPQLVRTPIHVVDVSFDRTVLRAYTSRLLEIGEESGLSGETRKTSPDPNDVEVVIWGKGIMVTSLYRLENSPQNYTIFIYDKKDGSSRTTADIVFAKVTQGFTSVPGVKFSVEK